MIAAAARALKPGGRFYMVANRGLPYEPLLKANFASFETLADNNKFRVTKAITDRRCHPLKLFATSFAIALIRESPCCPRRR